MHSFNRAIKLAFKNLWANLTRTALSLLGIVIGVMAIVFVMSLGEGVRRFVMSQVELFGTDVINIEVKTPNADHESAENASSQLGGAQITTFKIEDAEEVAKLGNVKNWYAGGFGQDIASREGKNKTVMIFGVTAGISDVDKNFEIEKGEMFSEEDDKSLKQVIVIGKKVEDDLFGNESALGKKLKINNQSYRVVGVLKERGGGGVLDFNSLVYMPMRTLQKKVMGTDYVSFAIFTVKDATKMDLTVLEMDDVMRDQHDIDDPDDDDFDVMSIAEAIDMVGTIINTMNILLVAMTSISLIVGGVGITNVMYVAVAERTFEIGLRKSVGAKSSDVFKQFLAEAVFLTFAGGFLGVIFGFAFSKIAEFIAIQKLPGIVLEFPLTTEAVVLSLLFSVITGIVFGMKPAITASKLSPMEAMRKE
jgi:putative ABC transport system permease protein